MSSPAEFLADNLGQLKHPNGDAAVPLTMFRTTGMNPDQADQVVKIAEMTGQAIIHTLETEYELLPKADAAQLRAAAAANEHKRHQQPRIHCACGTFLFRLNVTDFNTDRPTVNGPQLIKAMQSMSPDCRHGSI